MEDQTKTVNHRRVRVNVSFEAVLYEDDTNEALKSELKADIAELFVGDVGNFDITVENM